MCAFRHDRLDTLFVDEEEYKISDLKRKEKELKPQRKRALKLIESLSADKIYLKTILTLCYSP
jgi:hypothetical protein